MKLLSLRIRSFLKAEREFYYLPNVTASFLRHNLHYLQSAIQSMTYRLCFYILQYYEKGAFVSLGPRAPIAQCWNKAVSIPLFPNQTFETHRSSENGHQGEAWRFRDRLCGHAEIRGEGGREREAASCSLLVPRHRETAQLPWVRIRVTEQLSNFSALGQARPSKFGGVSQTGKSWGTTDSTRAKTTV